MSDAEYLAERAHQELRAAMLAFDVRVRSVHLEMADAYSLKLQRQMTPPKERTLWSANELARLSELCAGRPDWRAIAQEFGRTPDACRAKAINAGLFSPAKRPRRGASKRIFSACVIS